MGGGQVGHSGHIMGEGQGEGRTHVMEGGHVGHGEGHIVGVRQILGDGHVVAEGQGVTKISPEASQLATSRKKARITMISFFTFYPPFPPSIDGYLQSLTDCKTTP